MWKELSQYGGDHVSVHVTEEDTHKGVFQSQDLSTSTKKKFSDMMQELSQRVYYH